LSVGRCPFLVLPVIAWPWWPLAVFSIRFARSWGGLHWWRGSNIVAAFGLDGPGAQRMLILAALCAAVVVAVLTR
jgi:hypothetical protein